MDYVLDKTGRSQTCLRLQLASHTLGFLQNLVAFRHLVNPLYSAGQRPVSGGDLVTQARPHQFTYFEQVQNLKLVLRTATGCSHPGHSWRVRNLRPVNAAKRKRLRRGRRFLLEGQRGLEPRTPCLRGRCSNQLSYWPT